MDFHQTLYVPCIYQNIRRPLVRACDSLCGMFYSCDFQESQHRLDPFALSIGDKHSVWCHTFSVKGLCALYKLHIRAQTGKISFLLFAHCVYA